MNKELYQDAQQIIAHAIRQILPDTAVKKALSDKEYPNNVYLIAVGKAAWQMAKTVLECLPEPPVKGIVLTKYGHVKHPLPGVTCYEAGHPIPDDNSFRGTQAILDLTAELTEKDTVLFLLSGGGSALFEQPLVAPAELKDITEQLLACGADIVEMNTIRKRLSSVKGGRFAMHCAPARVEAVLLSDVLGDSPDMIASGPAVPDTSTCVQALAIAEKYRLKLSDRAKACLAEETPKCLENVTVQVIGSVRELCNAAGEACRQLGYCTMFLTDHLDCEACEAGRFLADIVKSYSAGGEKPSFLAGGEKLAFLAGGETVVHVTGNGLGGRNQELALAAATGIAGLNAAVFSVGSDGTDGPTDAAGGYVDGDTLQALTEKGYSIPEILAENDAYHALKTVDGLIVTGPTGTNVNDVAVALLSLSEV